jgi:hypothetical protein
VDVRDSTNTTTLNTLTIGSGTYKAVTLSNAGYISNTLDCTSVSVASGKTIIDANVKLAEERGIPIVTLDEFKIKLNLERT